MSSKPAAASKPPTTIPHKSRGDDAENRRKKPKKKKTDSTSDRVLNPRNDAATKTESSSLHGNKRKSEQISKSNFSVEQDDDSGCPKPKKPSPKHNVSIHIAKLYAVPHLNFFKFRVPTSSLVCALFVYLLPLSGTRCLMAFVSVNLTSFWKHL